MQEFRYDGDHCHIFLSTNVLVNEKGVRAISENLLLVGQHLRPVDCQVGRELGRYEAKAWGLRIFDKKKSL